MTTTSLIVPLLGASLLLGRATPSAAQRISPVAVAPATRGDTLRREPAQASDVPDHREGVLFGGLLGGVAGFVGGARLGSSIEQASGCRTDWCGLEGAIQGAVVGELIGVAAGAHAGARGHGSLTTRLIVTAAVAGAGLAVAPMLGQGAVVLIAVIPVVQLTSLVVMESR